MTDEFGRIMSSWHCDEFGKIFIRYNGQVVEVDPMQFGLWLESMQSVQREAHYRLAREVKRIRELD